MKTAKMSLLASLLLCTSSFGIDNVEVAGAGKFFYGTADGVGEISMFDKEGAYGQLGLDLSVGADLGAGFKGKAALTGLATAGMGGDIVDAVWASGVTGSQVWLSELYVSKNILENTALIVGRQRIDTPLVFTETWNIAANTFDAAVVQNSDLPDTTLIGAYIDRGNGASGFAVVNPAITDSGHLKNPFKKFYDDGAFAAGVINKSLSGVQLQGWYYHADDTAEAYWFQGDAEYSGMTLGLQAAGLNLDNAIDSSATSKGYAAKIGYVGTEHLTLSAAVSQTDKDGSPDFQIANLATGGGGGAQSKLYTEAWWNFGYVGAAGTTAYNVTALYTIPDTVDLGLFYTSSDQRVENGDADMDELTATAAKSFGSLGTSIAYIYAKARDFNDNDGYSTLQLYLTYSF